MFNLSQEAELLRKVPMFSKLEPSKLKLLAFTSESLTFEDGEALCHIGEPADCAFVIMSGEVSIMVETNEAEEIGFVLGSNELIGEMAVISNAPRSATVRAKGEAVVMRISDEAFLKLLRENSEVALYVMRTLSHRLAATSERFQQAQAKLARYESEQIAT